MLLGQRVARVAGGAAVDGGVLQAVQLPRHAANRTRARAMRGTDEATRWLFSHVDLEERIPARHPLRTIRQVVNDALANLDAEFGLVSKKCRGRSSFMRPFS